MVPHLRIEANYFNIRYRDRVVVPINRAAGALTNPLFADFRNMAPTAADVAQAIVQSATGLENQSGLAFDPNAVVAIIDNRNHNATKQQVEGVDLALTYRVSTGADASLSLTSSATYLQSDQELIAGQGEVALAGEVYNPPHWRTRSGAVWGLPGFTLAAFLNYIGGLDDRRFAAVKHVGSMTTVDLTMRFEPGLSALEGMSFSLTATNLLNDKPSIIRTTNASTAPFDSLNYSSIGRYVGFTVTRKW